MEDRRADDEWRGGINARVKALEDRIIGQDARAAVLGDAISSIRVDLSAMRSDQATMRDDLRDLGKTIVKDAEKRTREREDEISQLKATLAQRGLNRLQWALLATGGFVTAIVGPLIVAGLTGNLG